MAGSDELKRRLDQVRTRMAQAALRAGRDPAAVTLVAVSKTHPPETLEAAYALGLRDFGENRSAELAAKAPALAHLPDLRWHFVGALQTRQSLPVAQQAHTFHAVDRLKIAERLSRQVVAIGRNLPIFLEVNLSGEASKTGFDCTRWEEDGAQRAALLQAAVAIAALPGLHIRGLMTMAPWEVEEAIIRVVFARTRRLAEWLAGAAPQADWSALSMGMTDDFDIAIEEGATHIRVGRALFGPRLV